MEPLSNLHVPQTDEDDPEFIALVTQILNGAAARYRPEDVYVIQIDRWFGLRWKRWPAGIGSQVRCRWFDSLVVPPFHPHRVKSQIHFSRVTPDTAHYAEEPASQLHLPYVAHLDTSYRAIKHFAHSGLFFWYSSSTRRLDRASLMVYRVRCSQPVARRVRPAGSQAGLVRLKKRSADELAWYVGFLKHSVWRIQSARGISPVKVLRLASLAPAL